MGRIKVAWSLSIYMFVSVENCFALALFTFVM